MVPKYRALSIEIRNHTAENRLGIATSLRTTILEELESKTIFRAQTRSTVSEEGPEHSDQTTEIRPQNDVSKIDIILKREKNPNAWKRGHILLLMLLSCPM